MRTYLHLGILTIVVGLPLCALAADVKVTDHAYVRHDGASDAVIASCSSDATTTTSGGDDGGNRHGNRRRHTEKSMNRRKRGVQPWE